MACNRRATFQKLPILKSFKFLSFGSVFLPARFKTPCFKLYVHVPEASGKLSLTDSSGGGRGGEGKDVCRTRHGLKNQSGGGVERRGHGFVK